MLEPSEQKYLKDFMEDEAIEDIQMLVADYKIMKKTLQAIKKDLKDVLQEGLVE
jgi:hypothetical protein